MSNLLVSLVAEWKGQGAFKKAESATDKLNKGVNKLARNLGLALGAAGLTKFAKDSIKAFADEEKSIAMLSNALDNLGMGNQADQIYAYIDALQMATGVSDDQLRPAFQKLATAGLNAADAQSVLGLALDVSAGSGKDLETVSAALSKAVGGNTAALSKLGVGLTKDELKTMDLNEIMLKLADTYKNSAAKAAETFSGKMAKLSVAIDTAKESIGKGLIDGLMLATGATDITDLQTKIVNLGTTLASVFVATGNLIHDNWNLIKQLGIALIATFTAAKVYAGVAALIAVINKLKKAFIALRAVGFAAAVATASAINPVAGIAAAGALIATIIAGNKALDMFNKSKDEANENPFVVPDFTGLTGVDYGDAKRLEKLKIAAAKAQEKAAKAALKQNQLSKIFDTERIQIYAALQGQLSEEERDRVRLQLALLDENVNAAEYLAKKIGESQGQTSMLATFLRTLPDAKNPFEKWGDYLKALELEAKRVGALSFNAPGGIMDYTLQSLGLSSLAEGQKVAAQPGYTDAQMDLMDALNAATAAQESLTKIEVYLDGDIVGNAVRDSSINQSLSGSFNSVNRRGRFAPVAE
jgi:hypothetical protein